MENTASSGRWRLWIALPPIFVLSCTMLFVGTIGSLTSDIHHAIYRLAIALVEWARPEQAQ